MKRVIALLLLVSGASAIASEGDQVSVGVHSLTCVDLRFGGKVTILGDLNPQARGIIILHGPKLDFVHEIAYADSCDEKLVENINKNAGMFFHFIPAEVKANQAIESTPIGNGLCQVRKTETLLIKIKAVLNEDPELEKRSINLKSIERGPVETRSCQ